MANYYAVQFPTFQRAMRNILTIDQGVQTTITTTFDGINPGAHNYATGLIVRLYIPREFGMIQANQLSGVITVINSTQFTMDIDSTMFDPFVVPPYIPGWSGGTPPQVVPIGENSDMLTMATENVLPYP